MISESQYIFYASVTYKPTAGRQQVFCLVGKH